MQRRWRRLPRWVRLAVVVAGSVGALLLADAAAPTWVAAVVGFIFFAVASGFIEENTPELVERVLADAPMNAVVGADSAAYSDGWSIALPGELLERDYPTPGLQHLQARAHLVALGGYDVDESRIRVALEGRSTDTVIITGMRARIDHTEPPITDTLVVSPSAGEGRVIALAFDLDKDDSQALSEDGSNPFDGGYITLSRGEVQIFQLIGTARARSCTWRLEIEFLHRGDEKLMLLPDAEPFRTTPCAEPFARSYNWAGMSDRRGSRPDQPRRVRVILLGVLALAASGSAKRKASTRAQTRAADQ